MSIRTILERKYGKIDFEALLFALEQLEGNVAQSTKLADEVGIEEKITVISTPEILDEIQDCIEFYMKHYDEMGV